MLGKKTPGTQNATKLANINCEKQATESSTLHFFDGFLISPAKYSGVSIYTCDARSYDSSDFDIRLGISKALKREVNGIKTAVVKRYIVADKILEQEVEKAHGLNRIINPSTYILEQAKKQLMEMEFKYAWRHVEFSKLKSKKPILSLGVFNQYLQYNPRVYHYNGRFILRPRPTMSYSRTDTCYDLLQEGQLNIDSNLTYLYQTKSCVLRSITTRTISDIDPVLGISLIDYYRKEKKFSHYLAQMEANPNMTVLEIDHDRFNQGKNTTRYSIASCLVTPDIRLDDIPEQYRGRFMKNSHVNMNVRYDRVMKFLEGLNSDLNDQLLPQPVQTSALGLKVLEVSANRLEFGDGHTTNKYSAYQNFKSLTRHKVFKKPVGPQKLGVIPFKDSTGDIVSFSKLIQKDLKSIGIDCELQILEPYALDSNGRLNQFSLADKYASNDADCALIELHQYTNNWATWKNALSPNLSPQMITTEKMKKSGVSFNTALGVASCMGAMPIGLNGNLTGIKIWIGMDVYSEGRKHIAAASTVCDADGMLIGYPPSMVCSGERLDDSVFENTLRIILDGLSHHYGKEGLQIPEMIGLIRDGQFFENPSVIAKMEREYGVTFVIADVKKQGAPKLAIENGINFESASCGTIICGENGGYVQTTGDGSGRGTPVLREIRLIRGDVDVQNLLEDIFWLSKIHGGSTQQPGLPIPQAYAHKLAKMAGLGVNFPNRFNTDLGFL